MNGLKRMLAALVIAWSVSGMAHADEECRLPPPPSKIPDGNTASKEEMVTVTTTLKEYNADVMTYLNCLEFQLKQQHLTAAQEKQQHNDAVDVLTRVADKINAQIRAFNKKNG
jgi:hypothetical protein